MEKLIAFHGDPELKAAMLKEARWHVEQDRLIKGTYGQDKTEVKFKGCAIGCSIHSLARLHKKKLDTSDHSIYETELGIPVRLAYLEDRLFEGLPNELAMTWPERFLQAIQPGADLSLVADKMQVWVLREHQSMLKEEDRPALDGIIGLFETRAAGNLPTQRECEEVASKLRADRAYRADLADRADLAYLADRADLYTKQSEKLLELLAEAPCQP